MKIEPNEQPEEEIAGTEETVSDLGTEEALPLGESESVAEEA